MNIKIKITLLTLFFTIMNSYSDRILRHGGDFKPVIVKTLINGNITKGVQVKITDSGFKERKINFSDDFDSNLAERYEDPVETDHNSSALLWYYLLWRETDQGYSYEFFGDLVISYKGKTYFKKSLKDLYEEKFIEVGKNSIFINLEKLEVKF